MMRRRPQRTHVNRASALDSFREFIAITGRITTCLARLMWRYRTECGLTAVALTAYFGVLYEIALRLATVVTLAGATLVILVRPSRRLLVGRLRCARTRRRILATFRQTRVENADGHVPRIVRSRATPAGERLILSCRPGHSAELLNARVEELRAGARCRQVRITRHPNRLHRVTVDVIRRGVLAGVNIGSPLLTVAEHATAARTSLPAAGLPVEEGSPDA